MGYIPEDQISRLKDSLDIVDIVSEYVNLKRTGSSYKGLCPFHNEKTPSFTVSRERGNFHCFGCHEGGDTISFIMKIENLSYLEAIRFLADKSGFVLTEKTYNKEKIDKRQRLYKINELVMKFYFKSFLTNKRPQDYLKNRGFDRSIMNTFLLGYADGENDSLYRFLKARNISEEEMIHLGFIAKSNNSPSYYDKFRNRLMFPIIDNKKRIIGFGGRTIIDHKIKYINSPETDVFIKGDNLYGVNLVQKNRNKENIILVEGYMDVIGLYNKGINFSVASLGTALTENQAKLVKRYGRNIYIAYDSDEAGIKATLRAIEIFDKIDSQLGIIELPSGMDPDEYISSYGREAFFGLMKNAKNPLDYQLDLLIRKADDKLDMIDKVTDFLSQIERNVIRDEYIDKAAQLLDISKDSLKKDVYDHRQRQLEKMEKKSGYKSYQKSGYRHNETREKIVLPKINIKYLLEVELIEKSLYHKSAYEKLKDEAFSFIENNELAQIYDWISRQYEEVDTIDRNDFKAFLGGNFDPLLVDKLGQNITFKDDYEDLDLLSQELVERLEKNKLETRRDEIMHLLKEAGSDKLELTMELTDILKRLTQ